MGSRLPEPLAKLVEAAAVLKCLRSWAPSEPDQQTVAALPRVESALFAFGSGLRAVHRASASRFAALPVVRFGRE